MYKHFNKVMRMELSILRKKNYSLRSIAEELGVNVSSVSRELKRNSLESGKYNSSKANHKSYVRRKYSKYEAMKIINVPWLESYIKKKLEEGWTPEEISGRLELDYDKSVVSFKLIYKWIYSAYGQAYAKYLPSQRIKQRKRRKKKTKRTLIPNRILITQRPSVINERKRIGDFEGDTLGKKKGTKHVLAGIVDRKSRYFLARKVKGLRFTMMQGFKEIIPGNTYSLTLDNGVENIHYEKLSIPTYFCHPYSSWEKGSIENTFQRLRRYIPKGTDLKNYSEKQIDLIVHRMNNTPRKCLNFRTPAEVFNDLDDIDDS